MVKLQALTSSDLWRSKVKVNPKNLEDEYLANGCIFMECGFNTHKNALIKNFVILFVFFCAVEPINSFFKLIGFLILLDKRTHQIMYSYFVLLINLELLFYNIIIFLMKNKELFSY